MPRKLPVKIQELPFLKCLLSQQIRHPQFQSSEASRLSGEVIQHFAPILACSMIQRKENTLIFFLNYYLLPVLSLLQNTKIILWNLARSLPLAHAKDSAHYLT